MSMEDLLKGILGGTDSQARGQQAGGDPLSDLLRGILGGMATPQPDGGQAGAGALPDLLGGILGGGAQGASGLSDILGAILGSGGANLGSNAFLAPIVNALAEKLGLSPVIAQAVVGFVVSKLLPGLLGGVTVPAPSSTKRSRREVEGLDLDHLLEQMGSGQAVEPAYLRSTGMVDELAEQTGLDTDVALQSLQQVFGMFGAQLGGGQPPQEKRGLDHLLDTWEV